MKSIRTNNDIEGWHLGLNRRAAGKSQLPLYLLVSYTVRPVPSDVNSNQARFREEVTAHTAKEVPEPPDEDLCLMG